MSHYDEPYTEKPCVECEETEQQINDIIHWFEALLDLVYSNEPLDDIEFETCLDEMAHCLGKTLPDGDSQIARKTSSNPNKIDVILDYWKDANTQYFNNLTCSK